MYKLAIIGAGSAGYNAALYATSLGMDTVLIEQGELGGTCLNLGCIPTKSLLQSAKIYEDAKNSHNFGIVCDNIGIDWDKIYSRKNQTVDKLKKGIAYLIKKSGLKLISGKAAFVDNNTLKVGEEIVRAQNIIIATGAQPAVLAIKGANYAINSDQVLTNAVTDDDIIIIGGGVIGIEFATLFSSLGKKVTVLEYAPRILPYFDADAAQALTMSLKKQGVKIVANARVVSIEKNQDYAVRAQVADKEQIFASQKIIMCTGRKPNVQSLQLENVGIKYDKGISIDNYCRTSVPNIYAVGDVAGGIQLAHFAEAQGIVAVDNIAGLPPSINLATVPSVVYSQPEIAIAGAMQNQDNGYYASKVFMVANGKASIENSTSGFIKLVFDKKGTIMGAALASLRASELIGELSLAITNSLTLDDIISTIHPHPTLSESIRLCAVEAKKILKGEQL